MAIAIRPGEHACSRHADAGDRERLAAAFVAAGLLRSHKVIYLHDRDDAADVLRQLRAGDASVRKALASGQLVLRQAADSHLADGGFDAERTFAVVRAEHDRALAEGFAGLYMAAEMAWAVSAMPDAGALADWERRVDEVLATPGLTLFCQYDPAQFGAASLADAAHAHAVDVAPELAALSRRGRLAAAVIQPGRVLRLAGDLDFGSAPALAETLDRHFHGPLRLDLADLDFVDVAGMRALRGEVGRELLIVDASEAAARLFPLLAWDTDPRVDLQAR